MDRCQITGRYLEWFFDIDGEPLERQCKRHLSIAATFYEHLDEIINFFVNRSTNTSAESINFKIKAFKAKLRGVNDTKFFIFRLCKLYA